MTTMKKFVKSWKRRHLFEERRQEAKRRTLEDAVPELLIRRWERKIVELEQRIAERSPFAPECAAKIARLRDKLVAIRASDASEAEIPQERRPMLS